MLEAVFGLGGFFFSFWLAGWRPGEPIPSSGPLYLQATTMCLAGIVGGQVGNAFACRSTRASIFRLGLHTNRALILAIVSEVLLLAALVHVPPLAEAFGLASLTAWHWIAFACFGPLLLAAEEARKWLLRTWLSGAWRPTIV
jgi:magnesium-transporting ATPase (P-type)